MKKVGELAGVGTVWCYPKEVVNMISQFRMVVHRNWKMTFNIETRHETKDFKDLSYDAMKPQGFECEFVPNSQGLHVHKVNPKNKGRTLGTNSGDSKSFFGRSCHVVIESDGSEVEDVSIDAGNDTIVAGVTEDKTNDDSNR